MIVLQFVEKMQILYELWKKRLIQKAGSICSKAGRRYMFMESVKEYVAVVFRYFIWQSGTK